MKIAKNHEFSRADQPKSAEGRASDLKIAKNHAFSRADSPKSAEGRASNLKIAKNHEFLKVDQPKVRRGSRGRIENRKKPRVFWVCAAVSGRCTSPPMNSRVPRKRVSHGNIQAARQFCGARLSAAGQSSSRARQRRESGGSQERLGFRHSEIFWILEHGLLFLQICRREPGHARSARFKAQGQPRWPFYQGQLQCFCFINANGRFIKADGRFITPVSKD